jgi:hypothetical protein
VTLVNAGPRNDQATRRIEDLQRLKGLISRYGTDGTLHIAGMPEPDRSEAREPLDRVGDVTEEPWVSEERQKMLLSLADMETHVRGILERGQPPFRNG